MLSRPLEVTEPEGVMSVLNLQYYFYTTHAI